MLIERAKQTGKNYLAIFHKVTDHETLWFTEYHDSITDVWDSKRYWRRRSKGRYSLKKMVALTNNALKVY
jgi:hypothetical protein